MLHIIVLQIKCLFYVQKDFLHVVFVQIDIDKCAERKKRFVTDVTCKYKLDKDKKDHKFATQILSSP